MADEIATILDELNRAYDGDCWHGPPLREVLDGITASQAAMKHPRITHTVWALVNHLGAWAGVVADRIIRWKLINPPDSDSFPVATDTSDKAWVVALADLDREHRKLLGVVSGMAAVKLNDTVPGKDYSVRVMLHGTAQHYAYHAGQIALFKKLV